MLGLPQDWLRGEFMRRFLLALPFLMATPALAAPCGGGFNAFKDKMAAEAAAKGHSNRAIRTFFGAARQDQRTLKADRAQGIFRMDFLEFSRRVISQNRMDHGRKNSGKYDSTFSGIERNLGVPRGVLLAFWALETDYGAVQGDFNTLNSLMTLSHDCRRPELFQPQVFAALELFERGDFALDTTGAWAGEIGMVQMLPGDIIEFGRDGDGDGQVSLKTSPPDALWSGGTMLRGMGWRPNEPWLQEITLPSGGLEWADTGIERTKSVREWAALGVKGRSAKLGAGNLQASVILPMGRNGPAFLAYPNFNVYFEWNQSYTYVTTAAYFATRLMGAPVYDARNPEAGLSGDQMKALQQKLAARGHDVGKIDGILGSGTRAAVRAEQIRLGLPADAWPTARLLGAL